MYEFISRPLAVADIRGGNDAPALMGRAEFYQRREGVLLIINVTGLPSSDTGFFSLHIHEGEDCLGNGFADTKGHYNPSGAAHPMHAGDLPPLLSCDGSAYMSVLTNRFRVEDVIGRTVVIHSGADDFKSQPSGNAGEKIACGKILKRQFFRF